MIGQLFTKDYTGAPFELFRGFHLAALGIVILINLSFIFWKDKAGPTARRNFRYALAAVLVLVETAWHLWNLCIGQWTVQTMLPLHLCSVFVWLSVVMLVRRDYRIYEFAYFLGIGGAMQALLTPDAGIYGFPHFRAWQVMVSHGAIVTAAIYMTVVEGFRPTWKSLLRVLVVGNAYMLVVGVINALLGSNYLFIAHKPETASLMDLMPPWPWYILTLELLGGIVFTLLYVPFALKDKFAAIQVRRPLES